MSKKQKRGQKKGQKKDSWEEKIDQKDNNNNLKNINNNSIQIDQQILETLTPLNNEYDNSQIVEKLHTFQESVLKVTIEQNQKKEEINVEFEYFTEISDYLLQNLISILQGLKKIKNFRFWAPKFHQKDSIDNQLFRGKISSTLLECCELMKKKESEFQVNFGVIQFKKNDLFHIKVSESLGSQINICENIQKYENMDVLYFDKIFNKINNRVKIKYHYQEAFHFQNQLDDVKFLKIFGFFSEIKNLDLFLDCKFRDFKKLVQKWQLNQNIDYFKEVAQEYKNRSFQQIKGFFYGQPKFNVLLQFLQKLGQIGQLKIMFTLDYELKIEELLSASLMILSPFLYKMIPQIEFYMNLDNIQYEKLLQYYGIYFKQFWDIKKEMGLFSHNKQQNVKKNKQSNEKQEQFSKNTQEKVIQKSKKQQEYINNKMKTKESLIIYYGQNCKFEAQILENDTNLYFYANYFLHFRLLDQVVQQILILKDLQNEGIELKIKDFNFDYFEYDLYSKSNKNILEVIKETGIQIEKAQMCLKQKKSENYYYDVCMQAKKMCQQQYMLIFQSTDFMLQYNMNLLRSQYYLTLGNAQEYVISTKVSKKDQGILIIILNAKVDEKLKILDGYFEQIQQIFEANKEEYRKEIVWDVIRYCYL